MKYTHAPYWRGLPYSRAIRLSRGTTKLNLKNYTPVHVANRSFVILHPPSTSFTLVSFKLSLRAPKPAFHRINLPLRPIATVFQGVECGFVLFSLFYFSSLFAYFSFFFFLYIRAEKVDWFQRLTRTFSLQPVRRSMRLHLGIWDCDHRLQIRKD